MNNSNLISHKMMLAFKGYRPPPYIKEWLSREPIGGFTLFSTLNVESLDQIRQLTAELQALSIDSDPLLIATDQECGQFMALGHDTTEFAGNMALGAIRDAELTQRVGRAIGRELAALGVNVNYAPNCDVNTNPDNANCGIRAFGDEVGLVAEMTAAYVQGQQEAGVVACLKHFPGSGDSQVDSHYALPLIDHSRERFDTIELPPFKAGIDAGVKMVMTGHFAAPALMNSSDDVPATLSGNVMTSLLREELQFDGVLITDAFDMHAITQGVGQIVDGIATFKAGVDLLLLASGRKTQEMLSEGLKLAHSRKLLDEEVLMQSAERIIALKQWVAQFPQPALDIVNCKEHQALAAEVAQKSITLVKNDALLLPLTLPPSAKVAVVMPRPRDLTPADTSSRVTPTLAAAVREHHPNVDEFIVSHKPDLGEIRAIRMMMMNGDYTHIILGTLSASLNREQADMAKTLIELDRPTITVSLRTPYDLLSYPFAETHLCTYSILEPSMKALANAIFGKAPITGKLPVSISNLYPFGHGLMLN